MKYFKTRYNKFLDKYEADNLDKSVSFLILKDACERFMDRERVFKKISKGSYVSLSGEVEISISAPHVSIYCTDKKVLSHTVKAIEQEAKRILAKVLEKYESD